MKREREGFRGIFCCFLFLFFCEEEEEEEREWGVERKRW